jgi:hypothetical protein
MFRAWIEKNTLLPPGKFYNCIVRLDIGCAGLNTISPYPDFCLSFVQQQKKPSTTSQCSEKRSLKERIQSDSNMIQWYHASWPTHEAFFLDDLSIGRVSFNVVKSIFLLFVGRDVTLSHTWAELSFAVFRVTLFSFMHFILVQSYALKAMTWKMTIFFSS